jgi:DNA replication protein DnaC
MVASSDLGGTGSVLDRLLHRANVVVTDGDSYRMREARARKGTTLNKT